MKQARKRAAVLLLALATAGIASAQATSTTTTTTTATTTTTSTVTLSSGQQRVAERLGTRFASIAGSRENAVALATALRTGTPATLTYSTQTPEGTTITTVTIEPPTKPMGWGNVSHSLSLAQFALTQSGIASPTGTDLQAALVGGTVTVDGTNVDFAGVLTQRASGMGWGAIARTYDTTMGAVQRASRTHATTSTATAPRQDDSRALVTDASRTAKGATDIKTASGESTAMNARGVTTASGASSLPSGKGVTTASGASSLPSGKGVTTASGAASAKGVVTASGTAAGHGKGLVTASGPTGVHGGVVTAEGGSRVPSAQLGRGIVNASGHAAGTHAAASAARASPGVVTASGASGGGVTTAQGDRGGGHGRDQNRGKPGG